MKYCEDERTPKGKHIYRMVVTSRYKKYRGPILVGLRGISDGLVTEIKQDLKRGTSIGGNLNNSNTL